MAVTPSPDAPAPTLTGVVVLVPEADGVVGPHREALDGSATWGVPAHVTVLFPFAAPQDVDDDVVAGLAGAVASVPAFDGVFAAAFPEHQPYGGEFDGTSPHLTVGEARTRGIADGDQGRGRRPAAAPGAPSGRNPAPTCRNPDAVPTRRGRVPARKVRVPA